MEGKEKYNHKEHQTIRMPVVAGLVSWFYCFDCKHPFKRIR